MPHVHADLFGRSTGLERARFDAASFLAIACRVLAVEPGVLGARRQDCDTTRLRELVVSVGIERWGQRAGELGRVLGRHPDVVSRWARMAARRRAEDPTLAGQHDALDQALVAATLPGADAKP